MFKFTQSAILLVENMINSLIGYLIGQTDISKWNIIKTTLNYPKLNLIFSVINIERLYSVLIFYNDVYTVILINFTGRLFQFLYRAIFIPLSWNSFCFLLTNSATNNWIIFCLSCAEVNMVCLSVMLQMLFIFLFIQQSHIFVFNFKNEDRIFYNWKYTIIFQYAHLVLTEC